MAWPRLRSEGSAGPGSGRMSSNRSAMISQPQAGRFAPARDRPPPPPSRLICGARRGCSGRGWPASLTLEGRARGRPRAGRRPSGTPGAVAAEGPPVARHSLGCSARGPWRGGGSASRPGPVGHALGSGPAELACGSAGARPGPPESLATRRPGRRCHGHARSSSRRAQGGPVATLPERCARIRPSPPRPQRAVRAASRIGSTTGAPCRAGGVIKDRLRTRTITSFSQRYNHFSRGLPRDRGTAGPPEEPPL